VEVVFLGSWTDYYKQAVYAAAEDISNLITMDLPTHNGIDDIRITAEIKSIDGSGGTWGWGGYSSVRSDSLLPSQGYTYFDSADIGTADSYGLWQDLVFHEMLHALGFGTAWSSMGLVDNYNGDLRFNGTNAVDAYNTNYSQIAANDPLSHLGVPIETDGGSGTAGKHWDDKTFVNEIMTPNLNFTNHISDMTLAALEDMGYETIYPDEEEEQQEFLYF
jgi:hypothetical protein